MDMHAIHHIGDSVTTLIHQYGQALFSIVQGELAMLQLFAQGQVFNLAINHQHEQVTLRSRSDHSGAGAQRLGHGSRCQGIHQHDHRQGFAQSIQMAKDFLVTATSHFRPADNQLPAAAFHRTDEVIFAKCNFGTGNLAGVTQHIHQLLCIVLRVMDDQQPYMFKRIAHSIPPEGR